MAMDLEWDRPLTHRRGGAVRLGGLDVYYEFRWFDYLGERAQFRNGQCLAALIRETCPSDKTPALLLTDRDEIQEGVRETNSWYVFVLNLPRYLRASTDAALSYLADRFGRAEISHLADLFQAARPEVVSALVESRLDLEHIASWAADNPERLAQLRDIAGTEEDPGNGKKRRLSLPEIIKALEGLEGFDDSHVALIAKLFGPGTDRDRRVELVRRITEDPTGRYVTGEVLSERTPQRIEDARNAMAAYDALLADDATDETTMQKFIENNLWLLGLDYAAMRPRHELPRGVMDFILERYDGFHDLLELKSPQDELVRAPDASDGAPPAASRYALSPTLAQALAQVHVYRDHLSTYESVAGELYGLRESRDPRLIIVIGKVEPLPDHRRRVLRELNKSLHRVEVVPFDILGKRAAAILDNIERFRLAVAAETPEPHMPGAVEGTS